MTALPVPLTAAQVAAANTLHRQLTSWATTDRALALLDARCEGFGPEATLLKVVAINQLYGTNVYATTRMAAHVSAELARQPPAPSADPEADIALVERIAALPPAPNQPHPRKHTSFASKFAHFFIDRDRFPIYDEYAARTVHLHLGQNRHKEPARPYRAFVRNVHALRDRAGLACTLAELDRYLWLAGLYRAWQRNHAATINVEVATLFDTATPATTAALAALAPTAP